ncbi:MAG: DUF72 domain-containing protein [Terriglobales bacterium]
MIRMSFFAGTSGWAYAAWKPSFYPAKLPSKEFLKFYATQLNAVEVNYTFRRMLNEKIIANWVAQTPPEFRFVLKAHQAITHYRKLQNVEDVLSSFINSIQPLEQAGRLGPVLFQLPPNFKADLRTLNAFLELLPRKLRASFEFRDASWFSEEVFEALRRHKAALCIAESDERETPAVVTAEFAYLRLRKSDYSAAERKQIQATMRKRLEEVGEIYTFFKHEERPESPQWARELLDAVSGRTVV